MSDKSNGPHSGFFDIGKGFLSGLFAPFQRSLTLHRPLRSTIATREEDMVAEIYEKAPLVMERIEQHSPSDQMHLVSACYAVLGRNNPNNHFATAAAFIVPNIYAEVAKIFFVPKSQMRQLTDGTKAVFREIFPPMAAISVAMMYPQLFKQNALVESLRPRLTLSSAYLPSGLALMYQGKLKKGRELVLLNEQTHTLPPLLYSTTLDHLKYIVASTFFVAQRLEISATPGVPNNVLTTVSKVIDGSHLDFFQTSNRLAYGNDILKRISQMLRNDPEYVYGELTKLRDKGYAIDPELIAGLEQVLPPMDAQLYSRANRGRTRGQGIELLEDKY